jgi:hypothetical protein
LLRASNQISPPWEIRRESQGPRGLVLALCEMPLGLGDEVPVTGAGNQPRRGGAFSA